MTEIKFNINESVRFRLTEKGKALLGHKFRIVDKTGLITAQLWWVMAVIGPHLRLGSDSPIEACDLTLKLSTPMELSE